MEKYSEDEYLLISGVQHYAFCPRQWALIHIEKRWEENYLTSSGRIMHDRAHDAKQIEKRGDTLTVRALKISSPELGLVGECDVVEFHLSKKGVTLKNYEGLYLPYPVEYKRGKTKIDDCDRLQLCAQAMCLEEMLGCDLEEGALFYGEPRRREIVAFTKELREKLLQILVAMHDFYNKKHTPKGQIGKHCDSCSLKSDCVPKLFQKTRKSVKQYIDESLL